MPAENVAGSGVALRVENGYFRVFPYENPTLIPFEAAVRGLNPVVAIKIKNAAVHAAMGKVFVLSSCSLLAFSFQLFVFFIPSFIHLQFTLHAWLRVGEYVCYYYNVIGLPRIKGTSPSDCEVPAR